MTNHVRKVAVLGAGTMGAAIAAHCANVGLEVELLDAAPDDPEVDRNEVVKKGFDAMKKAKPAALMSEGVASRIRTGNFTDHLGRVGEADWVVEAIVERPEPKRDLFARIEPLLKDGAIVSSNTSGILLHTIAEGFSEGFRRRFLGTHFFNPPRYLKLLELIPTADTDPEVVETMRRFGERILGKGPVVAKDTPGFIGNRLGTFTGMQAMSYALDNGYGVEEVDTITGPLVGRPKTATFRLVDQVGLDVMVGVAENQGRRKSLRGRPQRRVARAVQPSPDAERDATAEPSRPQDRRRLLQEKQARQADRLRRPGRGEFRVQSARGTGDSRSRRGQKERRAR